jgi:hypothetical protein
VYNTVDKSWHSPSDCIWARDTIQIPGKVSVATMYKGHSNFFQDVLQIKKPDLAMHIKALKQRAAETPDRAAIMREMVNICALDPAAGALDTLSECKCLPVKRTSGEVDWVACSEDFAIIDRLEYGDIFRGKVDVLDFSLEEVHRISQFLFGLKLQGRYMSRRVEEKTGVEGGTLNRRLTEDLRKKAYAISR